MIRWIGQTYNDFNTGPILNIVVSRKEGLVDIKAVNDDHHGKYEDERPVAFEVDLAPLDDHIGQETVERDGHKSPRRDLNAAELYKNRKVAVRHAPKLKV